MSAIKRPYRWKADGLPDTYLCWDADVVFATLEALCAELEAENRKMRVIITEETAAHEDPNDDSQACYCGLCEYYRAALEDTP